MVGSGKQFLILAVSAVSVIALAFAVFFADHGLAKASGNGYVISGNTPGFIKKATDLGAQDPTAVVTVTAWLHLRNGASLDQAVKNMYTKGASGYHLGTDSSLTTGAGWDDVIGVGTPNGANFVNALAP